MLLCGLIYLDCKLFQKLNIDVIYLADSLGSLKPKNVFQIVNLFTKYWKGDLGIHAHNNMNLALSNSIEAHNNGTKWVDCTVTGMGRGPGNVKTEDLFKYFITLESILVFSDNFLYKKQMEDLK